MSATLGTDALEFARGRFAPSGKSSIAAYGTHKFAGGKHDLQSLAQEMRLGRFQCTTFLRPGEYQLLQVEAPNVARDELKSAIRWRIKDMLEYHVDDATLDVLDIPADEAAGGTRTHLMFAVAARNEVIQGRIREFEEARIPLSVIDIPETAQRNIAALHEDAERGVALAFFARDWGLLTISYRGELYLARRLDLGLEQLSAAAAGAEGSAPERVALEIQRTLDHFERQFRHVAVARLLLAPAPGADSLREFLLGRLAIPVQTIDLRERLQFDGPGPDPETQWRLFHHFGAALRHESKAL